MTKEQIIDKVVKNLTNIQLEYDTETEMNCWDKKEEVLRDNTKKEVYIVTFSTPNEIEYDDNGNISSLIEGYHCFCYVDAITFDILYYTKPHGYIEADGTGHWI